MKRIPRAIARKESNTKQITLLMKMFICSVIIWGGLLFVSCSEFLDVTAEQTPGESTFFSTDQDASDAMDAVYDIFSLEDVFGRNLFYEQAGCGDDFIYGRTRNTTYTNLANFNFNGDEDPLAANWSAFNTYLARANWVVSGLLAKGEDISAVQQIRLGEAYFMRAFCHFYLAYRYGRADQGVPFDRYEDFEDYNYSIPEQRATVMENYELIIEDLEKAAELLPLFEEYGEEDYGRAHRAAAWALEVKVYAYWAYHDESKWELIPDLVDQIEDEGGRDLLDSFKEVFTIENNQSSEYIWSVNSSGSTQGGSIFPGVVLENKAWGLYNGWGYMKPTLGLYEEFEENDLRRGVTLYEYGDTFVLFGETRTFYSSSDLESGFMLAKYMEPFTYSNAVGTTVSSNGDRPTTDLDLPIIRHAEMVLFKAEALIHLGENASAATELNRLRARAGLDELSTATMNDLMHERRCELAGEFTDRFMDLKRWEQTEILNQPKYGRIYENRDNPASSWSKGTIWNSRTYNPAYDLVFPYDPDEVTKAGGALKQNPAG